MSNCRGKVFHPAYGIYDCRISFRMASEVEPILEATFVHSTHNNAICATSLKFTIEQLDGSVKIVQAGDFRLIFVLPNRIHYETGIDDGYRFYRLHSIDEPSLMFPLPEFDSWYLRNIFLPIKSL
jgi:hypothetical protein